MSGQDLRDELGPKPNSPSAASAALVSPEREPSSAVDINLKLNRRDELLQEGLKIDLHEPVGEIHSALRSAAKYALVRTDRFKEHRKDNEVGATLDEASHRFADQFGSLYEKFFEKALINEDLTVRSQVAQILRTTKESVVKLESGEKIRLSLESTTDDGATSTFMHIADKLDRVIKTARDLEQEGTQLSRGARSQSNGSVVTSISRELDPFGCGAVELSAHDHTGALLASTKLHFRDLMDSGSFSQREGARKLFNRFQLLSDLGAEELSSSRISSALEGVGEAGGVVQTSNSISNDLKKAAGTVTASDINEGRAKFTSKTLIASDPTMGLELLGRINCHLSGGRDTGHLSVNSGPDRGEVVFRINGSEKLVLEGTPAKGFSKEQFERIGGFLSASRSRLVETINGRDGKLVLSKELVEAINKTGLRVARLNDVVLEDGAKLEIELRTDESKNATQRDRSVERYNNIQVNNGATITLTDNRPEVSEAVRFRNLRIAEEGTLSAPRAVGKVNFVSCDLGGKIESDSGALKNAHFSDSEVRASAEFKNAVTSAWNKFSGIGYTSEFYGSDTLPGAIKWIVSRFVDFESELGIRKKKDI